ncbi:transcriptional regulator, TetR family [Andreprevotia lacus DSM 23236]|jgi:AcrR family transcriptional regulator|uniref:Transcriptional regulator, TetR family n=1 Tax=Andreprevotia lacus DSM 23236 TaxID=1121001 RepID=A0A1W1WYZ7_9NEIS|nr:TetR/AcrR family transcriptional regulator [Andreprevotia lacus]SMC16351.1 transcriptional regulator, TetR family [Andreprevotia lacus DSM 23236]
MDVFWIHGYEGSSLSQLTEAMGINSPSLYAAFGSKEALFKEALDQYDREEGAAIQSRLDSRPRLRDAIEAMLEASAICFSEPGRPPGCMVLLSALNCTPGNAGVWQHLHERRGRSLDILRARFLRGLAEGDLPPGCDVEALTSFYAGIRQAMSMQAIDGASRATLQGLARAGMLAWDALVGQPATTADAAG